MTEPIHIDLRDLTDAHVAEALRRIAPVPSARPG